ncbi:MAG: hypothetical protein LDL33_02855, partial [Desulfomonile sp.]|nr:hypothetical protein [Desulfomonile sp.]
RCVSDSASKSGNGDEGSPASVGGTQTGTGGRGIYESVADALTDAMRALFNPLPDREGPCPGGREVIDRLGRKRCVTDSGSKTAEEGASGPSEKSGTGDASGKGFMDTVADTLTDALSALLNPLPDREGPCPGGREVIDKFGRKRCITDSGSREGFEEPGLPAEGKGGESSSKGIFDTVADTLTDALSALFKPLPDREGPCPGGREVIDKFGRKRCVTDAETADGLERPGAPSEGGTGGSTEKGLFESVADTLTDALSALLNPLPDREGPCPGGREVTDRFGRKRCVKDDASGPDESPAASEGIGSSASSDKGIFESIVDSVTDALGALLNPMADREGPCPGGREVVDRFGRKRCVDDAASADDSKTEEPSAREGEGSSSTPEGQSADPGVDVGDDQPGFFDEMTSMIKDAFAFLLNPLPEREEACKDGHMFVDKYGRKRCVSRAGAGPREDDDPAQPVEDSKSKPVSEGEYRTEDASAMPDTGSDSEPKGDEEASQPKDGSQGPDMPNLFDRMRDSFGAAIAFLLNPMPDREGPCGGGRQVVDRFGRKRCVSGR